MSFEEIDEAGGDADVELGDLGLATPGPVRSETREGGRGPQQRLVPGLPVFVVQFRVTSEAVHLRLICANVVFVLTDSGFHRQTVDRVVGDDSAHDLGATLAVTR